MAGRTQSQAQYQQSSINSAENHKASDETVDAGPSELMEHTARGILKSRGSQDSLPKKKSSFQITSVKKLPGDQGFEDADSLDDLDETHTEDVSSDMLDVSKSTDIEPDPPSVDTLHSVPQVATSEESRPDPAPQPQGAIVGGGAQPVGGSTPVVLPVSSSSKDKVQELQSRFKVVKIESKEPFRRGRWTCHDFLDPPAEKTAIEKSDVPSKPDDVGSGNSSAASSVHYVPGVDDPSKNPFGPGAAIGANQEMPHTIVEPKPVRAGGNKPMQNGQVQTPPEGNSSHIQGGSEMPVPAQGTLPPATSTQQPTVNGHHPVPSQSSMNAQQTMPAQGQVSNAAPGQQGAVQPGVTPGQVPSQGTVSQTGNVSMQQNTVPAERNTDYINQAQGQDFRPGVGQEMVAQGGEFNPHGGEYRTSAQPNVDLNQTQQPKPPQPMNEFTQAPHSLSSHAVLQQNQPALVGNSNTSPNKEAIQGLDAASQEASGAFPAGAEQAVAQPDVVPREPETAAAESITAKASTSQPFLSPPLLEMVIQQQPQLRGIPAPDSEGGASTVAIDNKIEQAMDLVKSHLMFAVREEVEVLKEQIKDLLEKNSQLEYENNILRGGASPETLAKLAKIESNKTQPPTTTS